ncbi:Clp protease N-terminal domain-containing protein [Salinispora arenicola]|uniref:Clp protease N-terminal domain-containing protein n=1 Tax=Salinispora arenicola TaxID=168697 RepID=UPI003D15F8ED
MPVWSGAVGAASIARERGHHDAGTFHLFAAARQEGGAAARLLTNLNLDREEPSTGCFGVLRKADSP